MAGSIQENHRFIKELDYTVTNESIDAVLGGFGVELDNHPRKILAVGGSGDIPFALLPFVDQIDVVDINPAQIDFIKQRIEQLRQGDFNAFLNPNVHGMNDAYGSSLRQSYLTSREHHFQQEGRLEAVREARERMKILQPCNVLSYIRDYQGQYPGIYLSNIMSTVHDSTKVRILLSTIQDKLEFNGNGLLYLSDGDRIPKVFLPKYLQEDEGLSSVARRFGRKVPGLPSVYRNVITT